MNTVNENYVAKQEKRSVRTSLLNIKRRRQVRSTYNDPIEMVILRGHLEILSFVRSSSSKKFRLCQIMATVPLTKESLI